MSAIDYVSGYLMAFGACVALARRAREGGSWLVRVALARVGKWIVDRGVLPEAAWRGLPEELPAEELEPLLARDARARRPHPLPEARSLELSRDAAVLEPAAGAARLPSAGMDFRLTPEQQQFRDSVLAFAEKHLAAGALRARPRPRVSRGTSRKLMAKQGLLGITIAEADGGQGGTLMDAVIAIETVASVCPRSADVVQAGNFGADPRAGRVRHADSEEALSQAPARRRRR